MIAAFFRHGSNGLLAAAILIAAGAFAAGMTAFSLLGTLAGALVFFVSEYTTHRFLFHAKPSTMPWLLKLQHRLHYDHHIDPPKLELLFLPMWFVVPTIVLYYGIYFAVTRDASLALSLSFGSACALFYYEWVHYVAHVPFQPVTPFGRYIKKYHLWHHFKNEHYWFGVTNPSMDYAGGTYRDQESVERSTTVREIWR
jgi:4-hydroxysphinganine ceramide fatty acyl 2-hydroxylase